MSTQKLNIYMSKNHYRDGFFYWISNVEDKEYNDSKKENIFLATVTVPAVTGNPFDVFDKGRAEAEIEELEAELKDRKAALNLKR